MISASFRTKVLLVTLIPVISTAIILAYILISGHVNEFNKRNDAEGKNIASYIALTSEYGVFTNDFEYLKPILEHTVSQRHIIAVYIKNQNESVVLEKFNQNYKRFDLSNINNSPYTLFESDIVKSSVEINDINDIANENTIINSKVGTVYVVINPDNVNVLRNQIILNGVFTTLFFTVVTIFTALFFSRSVTNPIRKIYDGIKNIKDGDLSHRIPVNFSGELAVLASGINNMTASLETARLKEEKQKSSLIIAKQQAEEASKAKSLFLSSMSHEMRTPMNAVLGFAQLIELDAKDEETKQNSQEILEASRHLLEIIEDLLELSQIESGKINLSMDNYQLKSIIKNCVSMVKSLAVKRSIHIDNKIDLLPDISIYIDAKRFRQIVLNVLTNAIKYNNENGKVTINYSVEDKSMLCFSVTDTGRGIDSLYHGELFSYFDRAGQECSDIAGTGLGLAISKSLVEKMGGEIGFESEVGKGSHFWIKVPLTKT